jgi:hypothetical protein
MIVRNNNLESFDTDSDSDPDTDKKHQGRDVGALIIHRLLSGVGIAIGIGIVWVPAMPG